MVIKYYTHQNPPCLLGETFKEPSLTRESDYVSLENLFERFCLAGRKPTYFKGAAELSAEEKDQILNQADYADLAEADLTEQKAFIDTVNVSVNTPKQEKVVKEPTQPAKQDVPEQPKADEPKDA